MDISGGVANLHMRIDAKNLVTTARTTHLPEQRETIHMISMLRKEACSESIQDVAHIPTLNCLADCLTKASAKADNLMKAVQTGKMLDVYIHPDLRTLMEHEAFLSTCCTTFLHRMVKNIPNRDTIEDFTEEIDEAEFVRQYNFFYFLTRMLCLCLCLMNFLLCVAPSSSSFVTMTVSISHWVVKSDSLSQDEDSLRRLPS